MLAKYFNNQILKYLMWQINLFLKLFYLIIIMTHNLTLTSKSSFYDNCNFIISMVFKGTY